MLDTMGWHYYNFALIPDCAPHVSVDTTMLESGTLWKQYKLRAVLARWTEDFDCKDETSWWYVIKDTPFDINGLKAKRRYEIRKGLKHFDVFVIDPVKYKESLYQVQIEAYKVYPKKYRPSINKAQFQEDICTKWCDQCVTVLGAFDKENGNLCGYARLIQDGNCIYFDSLKTNPAFEKKGMNAALVSQIMEIFDDELRCGTYICDGARNVQHETLFQDYLEKYFGFRKAFCHLRVRYNPAYKPLIYVLYLMRGMLKKMDNIRLIHKLNGVLMMEEIVRKQEKKHDK